jgi:putative addiction module component (TIGR02574 family)
MTEATLILEAALKLDADERGRLVEELSASLNGLELSAEWEDEIRRRVDDVESGRVEPVSGAAVFARLERRFGGR